jgi:RNA polymerase sigma factor (sigma-70 family)
MARIRNIDATYWARLKTGDPMALGYLYDTYVDKLYLAALKMTDDRELAKDALHEVFIELWTYRDSIGDVAYSQAYLVRVLRNILLKKFRNGKFTTRYSIASEGSGMEETFVCPEENREAVLISADTDKEVRVRLNKALAKLTTRQKLILKLHFYEGLSYEQIAERLSMNYQSVNNLAFRTIRHLRAWMFLF